MQDEFDRIELDQPSNGNRRIAIAVISILCVILAAVTAALLVRHFVITTYIVDGISMYPTLDGGNGEYQDNDRENGETLYLNMVAKIKRGDIVVFQPTDWDILGDDGSIALVKRVIAVGGDRLEIKDSIVYLNGVAIEERYINEAMDTPDIEEFVIPEGYIFCMGDNRNHSLDCRRNGAIPLSWVIGKCFMVKSKNGKLRFY